jgi:UDP-N-acetyl-2-amino-2-deoxyglucuronate dehydrogenase
MSLDSTTGATTAVTLRQPNSQDRDREDGRVKLGLAGYDLWPHSINFCRALEGADFARIAAIWDEEPRHRERLVELTGAAAYSDLDAFCRSGIEGAIITCRTSLRKSVALALADAGKHVLSDKPMAMNVDECAAIIRACHRGHVILMGGYNFRFWRAWRLMKRVMDSGELGSPLHMYFVYNTGMIPRSEWEETLASDWTDPSSTFGGGWLTHGDHGVDLARWLFDAEFTEVLADMRRLRYPEYEVEDYGIVHAVMSNGATVLIHSDSIAPEIRLDVTVICENGGMRYVMHPEPRLTAWGAESLGGSIVEYSLPEHWVSALGEMTRAFAYSIRTGTQPPVSGEDNLRVIEVAQAAYASARSGVRVSVEPRLEGRSAAAGGET